MPGCAITVCDTEGTVIFQNGKSLDTFKAAGDLRGKSLKPCHSDHSLEIMRQMIDNGSTNAYTINKNGIKKMIYQSVWLKDNGDVGGLVEISMVIPEQMQHFVR